MYIDEGIFRMVCFLALMQHGEGLMGKSPTYIAGKICAKESLPAAWNMLDGNCQQVVMGWALKWNVDIQDFIKGG